MTLSPQVKKQVDELFNTVSNGMFIDMTRFVEKDGWGNSEIKKRSQVG